MPTQRRPDEAIGIFETDLQPRYEPNFAWKSAVSSLLALPALRGCWPMSSVHYLAAGRCRDISGQGNHLDDAGGGSNVFFGRDIWLPGLAPIADFRGGVNQYLTLADPGAGGPLDILGTEAYTGGLGTRGLSLGGWFYFVAGGAAVWLMAKDDGAANRQYLMRTTPANLVVFQVFAGPVSVTSLGTISVGWNHIVAMYDQPNRDLHIQLNGGVTSNFGAAPAVLVDTAAAFTVGADGVGANRFTGRASLCFICASFIDLDISQAIWQQQRAMFNV